MISCQRLEVVDVDFEVGLRMSAYRANLWCFLTNYDVSAVATFPYFHFTLSKHLLHFYVVKQCAITLFVAFLDSSHQAEFHCQVSEAFLFCGFSKSLIHISPLVVFSFCSSSQVLSGVSNAVEFFEPHFSMLFLVVGSFLKEFSNLFETFLFCF